VDPLLQKLKETGVGCHMGSTYCGCLGYADDIVLLTPTRGSLKLSQKSDENTT
jgi:hypothetical protein